MVDFNTLERKKFALIIENDVFEISQIIYFKQFYINKLLNNFF
jgi:hypothetical protein